MLERRAALRTRHGLRHAVRAFALIAGCLLFALSGEAGDVGGAFSPKEWDSARARGMGDAFVAVADDASAINANPGGLAIMDHASATFDYADLYGRGLIKTSAFGAVFPTRWGVHGFSYRGYRVTFDPYPEKYNETTLGYSYAYAFGPLALGTTLKYYGVSSDFAQGTATGGGIDFGARYQLTNRWALGASIQNAYSNLKWGTGTSEDVPTTWRLGAAYRISERWLTSCEYDGVSGEAVDKFKMGTEYWILRPSRPRPQTSRSADKSFFETDESAALSSYPVSFAVRGGFEKNQSGAATFIPTMGAGLGYGPVRFDYAYIYDKDDIGSTHRYALTYDFKPWILGGEKPTAPAPSATAAKPAAATATVSGPRIAVLDFANATGNADNDWLCGGFADIVDRDLVNRGLAVVPRGRLAAAAGLSGPDIVALARSNGVDLVVRGVFVGGDPGRVVLSARLISVATGKSVDAVEVEGDEQAIFSLGKSLSAQIAVRAAAIGR